MSKLSRTVLKEIVKECIVEIFEESFFGICPVLNESATRRSTQSAKPRSTPKRPNMAQQSHTHIGRRSSLDSVSFGPTEQPAAKNEIYERKIDNVTKKLTNDPIMAEIFKDTASSTLQTQSSAESTRSRGPSVLSGGDAAAMKAHNSDPTELFAESASKWATLAFAPSIKK